MGTGFFGKLPAAGDFVARNLPSGLRPVLDKWLTAQIVPLTSRAQGWPQGGLRCVITLNDATWVLLIEPSADSVGRCYPLVACAASNGTDLQGADRWADTVGPLLLRGSEGALDAETLAQDLVRIEGPANASSSLIAPLIWWQGVPPDRPAQLLPRLSQLSSG
ncbi:type VI secretion system-associated protein TagF [Pseudosulfitobacter sp. DSM 107133]|uniref:type VI secretion system-associated protein TagF n=1 Tax=Pseudosulfitobacter sp. DSM 107133 TaxID=2883100 RepID=UPI000DF18743|nr:type VI secretion system-associated protein TagF [Pseudosulfitobacter sp. DSM 107133]UOA28983.1 hypothetical protein DSM107133_03742 [Pseudosulfitobacter sp. DSM 107133]